MQALEAISSARGTTAGISRILQDNAAGSVVKRLHYAISGGEVLDCATWADKYRVMGTSSRYRRWSTDRTPYLKEIMESISDDDPAHREVIIMKCSQVGVSEAMLNEILRRLHCDPCTILYFAENTLKADYVVSDRLDPALAQPPFAGRPVRSKLNRREVHSGVVIYNGANSPTGLSSTTAKLIIGDEAARYPQSIGGEGDFKTLAKGRTRTFGSSYKIVIPSTPTDNIRGEGTFIEAHEAGDKRRYFCPCAACGKPFVWELELCQRDGESAVMVCPSCGGHTHDGEERSAAMAAGEWVPTQKPGTTGSISYHVSGFMAPADWTPWVEILDAHADAMAGKISMQTFYNLQLGLPYDEPLARSPKPDGVRQLFQKQDSYRAGWVPEGGAVLTLAIDCQEDYLDCEVKAWGRNMENWSIARMKINQLVENVTVCVAEIRKLMEKDWPTAGGQKLRISLGCIDSGWSTSEVYKIAGAFPEPVIGANGIFVPPGSLTPTKGSSKTVSDRLILGAPGRRANRTAKRQQTWLMGTDYAKRELYSALHAVSRAVRENNPEAILNRPHCPSDYPDSHFQELVAEQIRTQKNKLTGRQEQVFYCAPNVRNEALDLHVMNRVAAEILGLPTWSERAWESAEKGASKKKATSPQASQRRERQKARWQARRQRKAEKGESSSITANR